MSDRRRKLTWQQVEQIRRARDEGQTMGQLAIRYQVDKTVIWRILNGLGYKPKLPTKRVDPSSHSLYFIRGQKTGKIKIGIAHDPERRLATLQTGSPDKLELLLDIPLADLGGLLERDFHEEFDSSHAHGEWFDPAPKLLAKIAALSKLPRCRVHTQSNGNLSTPTANT